MKNCFLCLMIFCCSFYCETVSAQDCPDDIFRNKLYSGSYDIINGKKWIYEKRYPGSPLLIEDYWPKADILYNGIHYSGILMNYDLYKNDIVVFYPEKGYEKYIVLNKDNLSGFSFTDTVTNNKHFYEYTELPGTSGRALYENVTTGKVAFFIKPLKAIEVRSADKGEGEFTSFYEYFLNTGTGYTRFWSKNQLVKLLPEYKNEINGFVRGNRLKINSRKPDSIIAVLKYLEGLK